MSLVLNDSTDLTSLGDAIRAKTGDSGLMTVAEMATAVSGIETGGSGIDFSFIDVNGESFTQGTAVFSGGISTSGGYASQDAYVKCDVTGLDKYVLIFPCLWFSYGTSAPSIWNRLYVTIKVSDNNFLGLYILHMHTNGVTTVRWGYNSSGESSNTHIYEEMNGNTKYCVLKYDALPSSNYKSYAKNNTFYKKGWQ